MILYPAIDVRGGRCVRLVQGDFARETTYDDDPISVARVFAAAGAEWLHVVDLDAARRQGDNRDLIEALAAIVPIPIQVGGGVRDETLLERGVARVVVGSLAVEDPAAVQALAARYPGRVAVGLDHRAGRVQVRGWAESSTLTLAAALAAVDSADLAAVVVTEIERDGMLTGPDLEGLAAVLDLTTTPVIASGGVGSVVDLRALASLQGAAGGRSLEGVIVGKAIYERRVDLDAGLRAVRVGPVAR